jgi:predicted alpha/beta-fold hydrolase
MGAKWLNRQITLQTYDEVLALPDGDFADLTWTEKPSSDNKKPIIVLLHGLHGSKNSHYIKGMFQRIIEKGWIGVLIHFRGCSGRPNRFSYSYHCGYTDDIHYFTSQLEIRYPHCDLGIIGYSLGGNVLAKYLSEDTSSPYKAAAIVCAPLHLASCSDKIGQGSSKIYQKYLVDMLKDATREKIALDLVNHITIPALNSITTLREFDNAVTAPLHGFKDANDYYNRASARDLLPKVTIPCLIIHAKDDPFLCHNTVTDLSALPDNITFEISTHGGHVGFIAGSNITKPEYWLESRIPNFLQDFL